MAGVERVARATGAKICALAGCSEPLPKDGIYKWCRAHEVEWYERVMGRGMPRRRPPRVPAMAPRTAPRRKRLPRLERRALALIEAGTATTAALAHDLKATQANVATALRWLEYDRRVERTSAGVYRCVDASEAVES